MKTIKFKLFQMFFSSFFRCSSMFNDNTFSWQQYFRAPEWNAIICRAFEHRKIRTNNCTHESTIDLCNSKQRSDFTEFIFVICGYVRVTTKFKNLLQWNSSPKPCRHFQVKSVASFAILCKLHTCRIEEERDKRFYGNACRNFVSSFSEVYVEQ